MTDHKSCRNCFFHTGNRVCLIADFIRIREDEDAAEEDPLLTFFCSRWMEKDD